MELIFGLHNLQPAETPCVATIGNFDGVHLGHQAVIGQLAEKAAAMNLPTTLITFEPTPADALEADRFRFDGSAPRETEETWRI